MSKFSNNMKEWLSFTRGERIGVAVLLLILFVVFLYPHVVPKASIDDESFEEFKAQVDEFEKSRKEVELENLNNRTEYSTKQKEKRNFENFDFDPNTADENIFVRLGFSEKQATVIINHRNRNGKFRTADDFKKVYIVSDANFKRLQPYIKIKSQKNQSAQTHDASTNKYNFDKPKAFISVEINSADTTELKKLRGIGSYYAKRIVEYRNKLGGFANANQLKEIYGIDDERFSKFSTQVIIDTTLIVKIDINKTSAKELAKHPYINNYDARGIEEYCKLGGKIENLQQLVKEKILTVAQAEKLQPYIEIN
jgi:competence ComEA-like helix-hairpin-helix protein